MGGAFQCNLSLENERVGKRPWNRLVKCRKYALESNVCNPAAGFKSKQKITTAYLLQRKNPVNYSLLIKYFKGRLRSRPVRLRRRLRGDT